MVKIRNCRTTALASEYLPLSIVILGLAARSVWLTKDNNLPVEQITFVLYGRLEGEKRVKI